MYSTKNIEKILLAELTRSQYNTWFSDSLDQSEISLRDLVKFRQNNTFKKIFGNQRRIFIPFEIKKSEEERTELKNEIATKIRKDTLNAFPNINYTWAKIIHDIKTIYRNYFILNISDTLNAYEERRYNRNIQKMALEYIDMYVNGYIVNPQNNKKEKFGKFVQKIIDLLRKKDNQISDSDDTEELQEILKRFNERTDWLNPDVVSIFSNKPQKWYAVISNDPQDVGAMSTGQGWTSCQDLDKNETGNIEYTDWNWHTLYDVSKGTCVAYLLNPVKWKQSQKDFIINRVKWREENTNKMYFKNAPIKGATARIAIKPFYGIDNNNKGQLYLSIGTNPLVYGTTPIEKDFVQIVNDFLTDKQKDTNGKFVIPNELYNEGLGSDSHASTANTVIVKNGIIVGIEGKNRMIRNRPIINKKIYKEIEKAIIDIFENPQEDLNFYEITYKAYGTLLFGTTFRDNNFQNRNERFYIAQSHFQNCKFTNIDDTITINHVLGAYDNLYMISMELFHIGVARDFRYYLDNAMHGIGNAYDAFENIVAKILPEYIQKNNLETTIFDNCEMSNIDFILVKNKNTIIKNSELNNFDVNFLDFNINNLYNNIWNNIDINLFNCTNLNTIKHTNNQYSNCRILANNTTDAPLDIYFIGDSFNNCEISIGHYLENNTYTIHFVDCTINGKFLEGEYLWYKITETKYINLTVNLLTNPKSRISSQNI